MLALALSFIFLFEFGRRGIFGTKFPWLIVPFGILSCLGVLVDTRVADASVRYGLGFTGGMLSCIALYQHSNLATSGKKALAMDEYHIAAGFDFGLVCNAVSGQK